jgi:dTMP kinase
MDSRSVTPGWLITFEGIEKVGKSTQVARVAAWLQGMGRAVRVVREPGATALGEQIRRLVLHELDLHEPLAEYLLFASARAELMTTVVLPALSAGTTVLMDRSVDSSVAYQGFGRAVSLDIIAAVNCWVTQGRQPDVTYWLDAGPGGKPLGALDTDDRVEIRDAAFFARVQAGYRQLWQRERQRISRIDATGTPDEVFQRIQQDLLRRGIGAADPRG